MKIETATIGRLKDALLQSGRRTGDVVSSAYETLTRAGLLSDDEKDAVQRVAPMVETMYLMMSADDRKAEAERDALRGAVRGLTGGILHDGTINVMLEDFEQQVAEQGKDARLRHVAATLKADTEAAEGAFALAAAIALADDEVADEERALIGQLAQWFGIGESRASQILDELEEDKQAV